MLCRYILILLPVIGLVHANQTNPEIGLSAREKEKFLQIHNDARRRQGSSNMNELVWDDHLAIIAWRWAENCNFTHGQINNDYASEVGGSNDIGQNLYVTEGETNKYGGVYSWISESVYYDYDTGECVKQPCGHYTMATWASSYKMGCAYAACPRLYWPEYDEYLLDAHNIVCHYWPGGNIVSMKPFKKGPACSECNNGHGWCNDGLCQEFCKEEGPGCECSNLLKCENCGVTDLDTCSCNCSRGFTGTWCNEVCRNKDDRCDSFRPGHCDNPKYGLAIKAICPVVCGLCDDQGEGSWECQGKTWDDLLGGVDGGSNLTVTTVTVPTTSSTGATTMTDTTFTNPTSTEDSSSTGATVVSDTFTTPTTTRATIVVAASTTQEGNVPLLLLICIYIFLINLVH